MSNQPNEVPPHQPPEGSGQQQWPQGQPPQQQSPSGPPNIPSSYPTSGQPPPGYGWQQAPPQQQQWGYPSAQYPGFPGGVPPKKTNTGLIVGIVVGVLVLLGAVVGGVIVFTGDDDDDSGDDKPTSEASSTPSSKPSGSVNGIENLEEACPLMPASYLSEETDVPDIESAEQPVDTSNTSTRFGCAYTLPDGATFMRMNVTVFIEGACEPEECVSFVKQEEEEPVEDVGDAAVFYKIEGKGAIFAVKEIEGHPVGVTLTGPGPNADADLLGPFVEEVYSKLS